MIDEQLAAAAREVWTLLHERPEAATELLKELVTERLAAAVDVIFTAFQKIRGERASGEPGESPADTTDAAATQEIGIFRSNSQKIYVISGVLT